MYKPEIDLEEKLMILRGIIVAAKCALESPSLHDDDCADLGYLLYSSLGIVDDVKREVLKISVAA